MFNRAHSIFLRQMIRKATGDPDLEGSELAGHIDLFYLNILPDALPFHGKFSPLLTHQPQVLDALARDTGQAGKKLLFGFRLHHLLDNLSHCGTLAQTGDFTGGFALKSGFAIKARARPEVQAIFDKVEGKSGPYTLHSGIEMAVDLCITELDINPILDRAREVFLSRLCDYCPLLEAIPGISQQQIDTAMDGIKQRAVNLPFADGVSLDGMTRRFIMRYLPSSDTPQMYELVSEFLELAKDRMSELWPRFLESSVEQVTQAEPRIPETLRAMLSGEY